MGAAILGLLVLLPLYTLALKPAWRHYRLERALDQAATFDAEQDYRNLLLSLYRAAQLGQDDIEAWQRIAGYLSKVGDEQAISARQQVVDLAPGNMQARLDLAADALRFGRLKVGQDALDPVVLSAAELDARYLRLASSIALHLGDIETMKAHLRELLRLTPDDTQAALDLAIAQAWSPDATERAAGRSALDDLLDQPTVRVRAALELLKDAARQQDGPRAAALVERLLATFPAPPTTTDRPAVPLAPLEDVIARLKYSAQDHDTDVAALAAWLSSVRRSDEALRWLQSLAPARIHDSAITEIYTELLLSTGQLGLAVDPLLDATFGPISSDTLLLATGAQRLAVTNHPNAADVAWTEALTIAKTASHNGELRVLARLASIWQRPAWGEAALQAVVTRSPQAFWAYAALHDQWVAAGKTELVWSLLSQWVQRDPHNIDVVTAWLRLGLARPETQGRIRSLAAERLEGLPASPRTLAAQAAWAWLREDSAKARELLQAAGPGARQNPDAAFFVALIERPARPLESLPVLRQLQLLPEERNLLTQGLPKP
ncbi:hypothetical protein [Actomonas aquatica]|uniref:Heme biosynthesis protein HemY n=1 Tax=Actomonas aquatica TaxID=2866162 RepID=A0ABZ1CAF8_9BACT|nr:hypothetical protein [Opitutus sp. WL0086]WRQ88661.1 hypothetical protein K1X11_004545 [Opitutus sp. WL0086]